MLDDAVATQDTVTQLIAAIRKVRKLVRTAVDSLDLLLVSPGPPYPPSAAPAGGTGERLRPRP